MLQIIPAVDVLDGAVVRLMHGDYDQVTIYGRDPVSQCRAWLDQGASLVHVVDLNGARYGEPDIDLWSRLGAAGIPFQIGGGIRSAELASRALGAGARRVVLGTAAVWNPSVLARISESERVVAAVDVRNGNATGAGWTDQGRDVTAVLRDLAEAGIGRLLVTGIDRDGTMEGPSHDLLADAMSAGRFAVIASGGIGTLSDLDAVADLGCEAAIVGRALYEARFSLGDAIDRAQR